MNVPNRMLFVGEDGLTVADWLRAQGLRRREVTDCLARAGFE